MGVLPAAQAAGWSRYVEETLLLKEGQDEAPERTAERGRQWRCWCRTLSLLGDS